MYDVKIQNLLGANVAETSTSVMTALKCEVAPLSTCSFDPLSQCLYKAASFELFEPRYQSLKPRPSFPQQTLSIKVTRKQSHQANRALLVNAATDIAV